MRFVFHHDGTRIGDFRKSWATACTLAGVDGRLFHDLRRTACMNMIKAGVPQIVAMRITGHETDHVFRRYAIADEEQKRLALSKTANYLTATVAERKLAVMSGK